MAALPPIRKLYIEDFPTQKSWIGPFLSTLNLFLLNVVSAFDQNLTVRENTTGDIKKVVLNAVPTQDNAAIVSWGKKQIPTCVCIGNIQRNDGDFLLTSAVSIQWEMAADNLSIRITDLFGVTPSQDDQYTLTLLCMS